MIARTRLLSPARLPKLRPLRIASLVAAGASVAAAARKVGVTQSAATQAIGSLETSLGVRLFVRGRHGLAPNNCAMIVRQRYESAASHLRRGIVDLFPGRPAREHDQIMDRLTTRLIETLLALRAPGVATGVVATRLQTSRSAIYRSLHELEGILGCTMLERDQNESRLTPQAAELIGPFMLASHDLNAIAHDIAAQRGEQVGEIRLGSIVTGHPRIVPEAITRSLHSMPRVTCSLITADSRRLLELLTRGEIDFAVVSLKDTQGPGLVFHPMGKNPFHVACRKDHPVLKVNHVTAGHLAAFPWIIPTLGSNARSCFELIFENAELPLPQVLMELDISEVLRGSLARSDCLALMSAERILFGEECSLITTVDFVVPGAAPEISLATRSDWTPFPAQQRFLELIRTARQNKAA